VIQEAGRIELFRRVLSWNRYGLATFQAGKGESIEVLVADGSGVEMVEREEYDWLSRLAARMQEPAMSALSERQSYIDELMNSRVRIWRRHYIGYQTTPEIDAHFQALGLLYSQHLVGQDSFPGTATFGGVPFDAYRAVVATLIAWSMKHVRFCNLLARKNDGIRPANVLTTARRVDDLARSLAHALELRYSEAERALSVLTVSSANVGLHYNNSGGASPPLIAIGDGFLLESAFGWQSAPFMFMLSGLRRNYQADWDREVGFREDIFRSELYQLFRWADVVTLPSGCKLRDGARVLTDVDAVIAHRPTRSVGLFQLKCQDAFGGSMRARASRRTNLRRETHDWLDNVTTWLSTRSMREIASGLGLNRFGISEVGSVETFVLGRHFANFSGDKPDERAVWGVWPQVLRLFDDAVREEGQRGKAPGRLDKHLIDSPLKWLADGLRQDSPTSRLPDVLSMQESVELNGVSLIIRSALSTE
jgi:hypothetical protein